jgi:hypothetical protein
LQPLGGCQERPVKSVGTGRNCQAARIEIDYSMRGTDKADGSLKIFELTKKLIFLKD